MHSKFYIYKITNRLNGKVYIGQSIRLQKRWTDHKRLASNIDGGRAQYIHYAIAKYKIDNFIFEVIDFGFKLS
jgi:group I intron endonuclease